VSNSFVVVPDSVFTVNAASVGDGLPSPGMDRPPCGAYLTHTIVRSVGVPEPGTGGAGARWAATSDSLLGPRGVAVSAAGTVYLSMRWGSGTVARVRLCSRTTRRVDYLQPGGGWGSAKHPTNAMLDTLALDPSGRYLFVGHREGKEHGCAPLRGTNATLPWYCSSPSLWRCNLLKVDVETGAGYCLRQGSTLPVAHDSHVSIYCLAYGEALYVGGELGIFYITNSLQRAQPLATEAQMEQILPVCCRAQGGVCTISGLVWQREESRLLAMAIQKSTPRGSCNMVNRVFSLTLGCGGTCITGITAIADEVGGFGLAATQSELFTTDYSGQYVGCTPYPYPQLAKGEKARRVIAGQECVGGWMSPVSYARYGRNESCSIGRPPSTWLADGDWRASSFYHPFGLACWPSTCQGGVLVADQNNNALRLLLPVNSAAGSSNSVETFLRESCPASPLDSQPAPAHEVQAAPPSLPGAPYLHGAGGGGTQSTGNWAQAFKQQASANVVETGNTNTSVVRPRWQHIAQPVCSTQNGVFYCVHTCCSTPNGHGDVNAEPWYAGRARHTRVTGSWQPAFGFFGIPKNACTQWKGLLTKAGKAVGDAGYVTGCCSAHRWSEQPPLAVVFRNPLSRYLSGYLDKFPGTSQGVPFSNFLHHWVSGERRISGDYHWGDQTREVLQMSEALTHVWKFEDFPRLPEEETLGRFLPRSVWGSGFGPNSTLSFAAAMRPENFPQDPHAKHSSEHMQEHWTPSLIKLVLCTLRKNEAKVLWSMYNADIIDFFNQLGGKAASTFGIEDLCLS